MVNLIDFLRGDLIGINPTAVINRLGAVRAGGVVGVDLGKNGAVFSLFGALNAINAGRAIIVDTSVASLFFRTNSNTIAEFAFLGAVSFSGTRIVKVALSAGVGFPTRRLAAKLFLLGIAGFSLSNTFIAAKAAATGAPESTRRGLVGGWRGIVLV